MFCQQCGTKNNDGVKFSTSCGTPLGAAGTQTAPARPVRMQKADEVEFKIHGEDIQFVEIMLDPGETIVAETGAMMYMDQAIQMETMFGDGSGKDGGDLVGKLFSAGKRALTGEGIFITAFTNTGHEKVPSRVLRKIDSVR